MGNLEYFLGIQIDLMKDESLFVRQTNYACSIINKFNMLDAKAYTLDQQKDSKILRAKIPYRQAVCSLLFLSQVLRPDIAYMQ